MVDHEETRYTRGARLKLSTSIEQWEVKTPFRITGHTFLNVDVLLVTLECDGHVGCGEACGVYYRNDTPATAQRQVEAIRPRVEAGITREALQQLLPPGGARNALDCALWDLESKLSGKPAWQIAGLDKPHRLVTTFTCGADEPGRMTEMARNFEGARAIKLKLTGEPEDAERVIAVRDAKPNVWLGVDGNQGFNRASLEKLMPTLEQAQVALIEQPFPIGKESWLEGLSSPIAIAADESAQSIVDIAPLANRVNVINIKLDKCGGLTEGLAIARKARDLGLKCMVGNMLGTSLAMAPAYLVGQLCEVVDLDGPAILKADRDGGVRYVDGYIECPEQLWGFR
jgi:L-alanine-DL-glutamate epimerase-like enolase superfamily enzyme